VFPVSNREGAVFLAQSKTNYPILCSLSARGMELVAEIRRRVDSPFVLPWLGSRCNLDRWFNRLVLASRYRA
jgi:hypothetical protein